MGPKDFPNAMLFDAHTSYDLWQKYPKNRHVVATLDKTFCDVYLLSILGGIQLGSNLEDKISYNNLKFKNWTVLKRWGLMI